jgi:hypothetical protein
MPGRNETTAGSAASNAFSISRAGPTGPIPGQELLVMNTLIRNIMSSRI